MMLGRFASHAHLRCRDGRHYWGWAVETKIADGWFIGLTLDLRSDEPEVYLSSKDVAELNPCSEELCRELSAALPLDQPELEADEFANALGIARHIVTTRKTGGVL